MEELNYCRYLEAKKSVDDRALNPQVYENFLRILGKNGASLAIIEIGAGTGAMLRRLLAPQKTAFPPSVTTVEYTLLDIKWQVLDLARKLLLGNAPQFAGPSPGMKHEKEDESGGEEMNLDAIELSKGGKTVVVKFVLQDARSHFSASLPAYDAVIASSFFDLVDNIAHLISLISKSLVGIRAIYFAINFSGVTRFDPQILQQSAIHQFHRNMGFFQPGNLPRASSGSHLSSILTGLGYRIEAEGPSNWNVSHPYAHDECYFLKCILSFIEESTSGNEDAISKGLHLISRAKVTYFASNLDICASL